jgi:CubicO group peptidase (beta-lactamase class C family)
MNKRQFHIILFLLLIHAGSNAQNDYMAETLYARINNYLEDGSQNGFSGAIAVVEKGNTIINKGYGMANQDTKTHNNPNTVFDIGSNTKQFTSTAILKLVELGKLKLNDPLSTFFKQLPKDKQNITIHQLLTHTSGFTEAIGNDFEEISTNQFFEKLFATQLMFEPGEKYSYSNVGYSVLGRIIELVSGQSYEGFLNEHLFTPAGMKHTGYLLPEWDATQLSRSYNRGILEGKSPVLRYLENGSISWHLIANGGINSTQNDMLLWHKALKTNKILSSESFNKLTTPYADYPSGTLSYAYGWAVRTLENNVKRIAHNGSNGAYAHSLIWFPEEDIFITYATNANSAEVEFLAYEIAKIILDKNYVPKPVKDNVYSFAYHYMKTNQTDSSNELINLLEESYADEFSSSRLLNSMGNLLLMMNENRDWAIELFELNVQQYPEDGNLWDSLGDGYMADNRTEDAIKSYQKAINLGFDSSQEKLNALLKN